MRVRSCRRSPWHCAPGCGSSAQGGDRWVEARDFFSGLFTTALEPDEILVEVALPPIASREAAGPFRRSPVAMATMRRSGWRPVVSLDEAGRCREARLVYLSVGDAPVVARRAAAALAGEAPSPAAFAAAAATAAEEEMDPGGDIHASAAFKRHLAQVVTRRALAAAVERAEAA